MSNSKYLQKMFFLLVMGFSLSFVYACGDDEDDEPFTENTGGGSTDNSGNGDVVPNDSTSSGEGEGLPQDSTSVGDEEFPQDSAFVGGEEYPQDSIFNDSVFGGDEPLVPADSIVQEGHVAVNLGLSVKWATCNVGASSPEDFGDYYAWGETTPNSIYDSNNCVTYDLSDSELMSRGIIGSDGNLAAAYDAATVNWGSAWRMPTADEVKELIDNCTWTLISDHNGYKVTGPNGNSIFLPAAGFYIDTDLAYEGSHGNYWTATPNYSLRAIHLFFNSGNYLWDYTFRNYGLTVRPVTD